MPKLEEVALSQNGKLLKLLRSCPFSDYFYRPEIEIANKFQKPGDLRKEVEKMIMRWTQARALAEIKEGSEKA